MEAIIRHRGRQFKVKQGSIIALDEQSLEPGTAIEFPEVLLVCPEGGGVKLGRPTVPGARVLGKVVGAHRGPKLIAAQFRRRKNSRRRIGHRQLYTKVSIESIEI